MDPFKGTIISFHEFEVGSKYGFNIGTNECFVKYNQHTFTKPHTTFRNILKFDQLKHIFRTKHYNCVDISLLVDGNSYKIDGGGFSSGWCDVGFNGFSRSESVAVFRFVRNYFG
jgi:hypothetical protein